MLDSISCLLRPALPADFDADFYIKAYPDLRRLKTRRRLYEHYLRHGQHEGRFTNLDAARRFHARQGRVLPADFDVAGYKRLNPDLAAHYTEAWQYELHYLSHGLGEGRAYAIYDENGRAVHGYRAIFSLYEFLLFSEDWRPAVDLSFDEAVRLFEEEGIARLTPIACGYEFDASFYREAYGFDSRSDADLYRHWLFEGFEDGRFPNEQKAIAGYVGDSPYPRAFQWEKVIVRASGAARYRRRLDALDYLFAQATPHEAAALIDGPEAALAHLMLGEYDLIRGHYQDALEHFGYACRQADAPSKAFLLRGDAERNLGDKTAAVKSYLAASEFSHHSIWAVLNAARLLVEQGHEAKAYDTLRAHRPRWEGEPLFRRTISECIDLSFGHIAHDIRRLIEDARVAEANDLGARRLAFLEDHIAEFLIPAPIAVRQDPRRIVMLACLDLAQCKHYRVDQKVEQLRTVGLTLEVFDFNDPTAFIDALPGAAAAIFYRVPSYPKIMQSILYARALGIATFYDLDDLVFTQDFPDTFESYEGQISRNDYIGLQHGVPLYRQAISMCDVGIGSTRSLADELAKLVRSKTAHVVANGLDSTMERVELIGRNARLADDRVRIFYGSGTKAHNKDFNELVGPALRAVMATYPEVDLVIVGHLALDGFDDFAGRVQRFPFVADRLQYFCLLASCDINLSVLQAGRLADCKSEIKWLEAAVLQIPSVVSRTATYVDLIEQDVDGIFVDNCEAWTAALSRLIEAPQLRRSMGAQARAKALARYSIAQGTAMLVHAINSVKQTERCPRRTKILVCNVFYAPQSKGGATHVVEQNTAYFAEHLDDAFELSILCSDEGSSPGALRVDNVKGCLVYRVGTPVERNMDWRPFNEDLSAVFHRILDLAQPDLVHLHSIQRLTATLAETLIKRNVPYIVTAHDAWWISDYQFMVNGDGVLQVAPRNTRQVPPKSITRVESIERKMRLASVLNNAARTLAVSAGFSRYYIHAGIENVEVVRNGVPQLPVRQPSQTRDDRLVLGHLGGRSMHKGATLLEIVLRESTYENLELIMIDGRLDEGVTQYTRWGATDVRLMKNVPFSLVAQLFSEFDVLVAPSIWPESFGLVTREAAHFGKWIIASDRGDIASDIVPGVTGHVVNVSGKKALKKQLAEMNQDFHRFKKCVPMYRVRNSDEQAIELSALYRHLVA